MALSGVVSAAGAVDSVGVRKSYPPLSVNLDVRDAVAELDRRTRVITDDVWRIENQLHDKSKGQDGCHNDLLQTFARYTGEQAEQARQRDIRDIRRGFFGPNASDCWNGHPVGGRIFSPGS